MKKYYEVLEVVETIIVLVVRLNEVVETIIVVRLNEIISKFSFSRCIFSHTVCENIHIENENVLKDEKRYIKWKELNCITDFIFFLYK